MCRCITLLLCALIAPTSRLCGQTGSLALRVVDAQTKAPIANAAVQLDGESTSRFTDQAGWFAYHGLSAGEHTIAIRSIGYAPLAVAITIPNGATVARVLQLTPAPVPLSGIVIVADSLRWTPLASARLGAGAFALTGRDPEQLVRLAKALAGTTLSENRLYVDGLPAGRLPATPIAEVTINRDPFSVLYSESDQNIIEVTSANSDRMFRWNAGYTSRPYGGSNPLAPSLRARRTFADGVVSGPVPFTALEFSSSAAFVGISEDRPVFGSSESGATQIDVAHSHARSRTVTTALAGSWRAGGRARLSVTTLRAHDSGAEAGGFVQWDSPAAHSLSSRDVRLIVETLVGRYRYSTGVAYTAGRNLFVANPAAPALTVLETLVKGGAPFEQMTMNNTEWRWHNSVAVPKSSALVGWSVGQSSDAEMLVANAQGQLFFGTPAEYGRWLAGQPAGIWVGTRGDVAQSIKSTTAAVFGERTWHPAGVLNLRAGLRADFQSGDGVLLSPRVSLSAAHGRATGHAGIGVFRQNLINSVLLESTRYRSDGGSQRVLTDQVGDVGAVAPDAKALFSEIGPGFGRPGAVVLRYGVSLRGAHISYGAEHSWTAGFSRAGSRRLAHPIGWVDRLESSRRLRRQQVHARITYAAHAASVSAHYEWVASHDDSDGPFSFPERQDAVAAEWARSAGVAPHNISIVAALRSLFGAEAAVVFGARSQAPVNLRTGLDVEGTGLYSDRGGRRRNDAMRPGFRSLDLYAHRIFRIPLLDPGRQTPAFDVSLYAENVLGTRNYLAVGSSLASPFLGRAVAALPGRSARLSFRLVQR